MDAEAVADELYGLRPDEFTSARNERAVAARKEGDRTLEKHILALRRPTLSAWASNLLVREHPEEADTLLELGKALRQAYQNLDADQLRELGRRQHTLISALARQARRLTAEAGQAVSETAQREIEDTLRAALADPQAGRQWAAGHLAKPLTPPTGFAGTDAASPAQAPAAPQARPGGRSSAPGRGTPNDLDRARQRREQRREQQRRRVAEARRLAQEAERRLRDLEGGQEEARREADEAREERERTEERIAALTAELDEAKADQHTAHDRERSARKREREAEQSVRDARGRAEDAAAHAQRLADQAEHADQPQRSAAEKNR